MKKILSSSLILIGAIIYFIGFGYSCFGFIDTFNFNIFSTLKSLLCLSAGLISSCLMLIMFWWVALVLEDSNG